MTLLGPLFAPGEIRAVFSDQACLQVLGTRVKSDALLVGPNGGVANAFVYIKSAFTDYVFETPTRPVTLDQRGCHYTPQIGRAHV